MVFFIRADASIAIGSGHVVRCLTLADLLCQKGHNVSFLCRNLPGNLSYLINEKGYSINWIYDNSLNNSTQVSPYINKMLDEHFDWESDFKSVFTIIENLGICLDWLIVDHYELDYRWENQFRKITKKIMIIDDLANRVHDCDRILDQNYYRNLTNRYDKLVPNNCRKLLGPKYALLRPEFVKARENLRERNGEIKKILIFFGGSDPSNETLKALRAIHLLNKPEILVDVVVGATNPHKNDIEIFCTRIPNITFHCQTTNMAHLMINADLSIGAGGSTMLERCFLGLPTITLILAQNQEETTLSIAETGAICNLGWNTNITEEHILDILKQVIQNPEYVKEMGKHSLELMKDYQINNIETYFEEV